MTSSARDSTPRRLASSIARVNAVSLAVSVGVATGAGLFIATMILHFKGGPSPGHNLVALSYVLPGYGIYPLGALIGLFWGFLAGFLFSFASAWLYYRGVLKQIEASGPPVARTPFTPVLLQVPHFATAFGLISGFSLLLITLVLIAKHRADEPLGPHLSLLSNYLPGYQVSVGGGFIGFFYFLVLGGFVFGCTAALYNRLVMRRSLR